MEFWFFDTSFVPSQDLNHMNKSEVQAAKLDSAEREVLAQDREGSSLNHFSYIFKYNNDIFKVKINVTYFL